MGEPTDGNHLTNTWSKMKLRFGVYKFRQEGLTSIMVLRKGKEA